MSRAPLIGPLEEDVLRKLGATLLALPILLGIYLVAMAPRRLAGRAGASVVAGVIIAVLAIASLPPARSSAVPASSPPQPVAAEMLGAVATGHGLARPVRISFDAPMDAASVAAALRISPDTAVSFDWTPDGRTLSIAPVSHWQPDTLYVVTVDPAARAASGGTLARPLRAVYLTAAAGVAAIAATNRSGSRARTDTAFRITLDRPLAAAAVRKALSIDPPVEGTVVEADTAGTFVFTPAAPLAPDTRYRLSLAGLDDANGVAFATPPVLEILTAGMPGVVRFRPRTGQQDIQRSALLSIRFTERMNRAATASAVKVTAGGKAVKGTVAWAEEQRVLVFRPAAPLPYGAKVIVSVGPNARSRAGVAVGTAVSSAFTVEPKPKPKPKPAPKPAKKPAGSRSKPIGHSGGGGAASGSWAGVESYYLRLMNCTRTGGWVTSNGSCSSPGGRSVSALSLSSSISAKVSRPYAKRLATGNDCSHFIGGNPGDRLERAGFKSYRWAENLGCRSGNPYSAVLGSHLYFQSEKPYRGGHYVNMMNAQYDRAGIGVWVSGGRVRLVVDFYHP